MKFLGIGPIELIVIIFIAVLVLGPEGILNSSRKIGKTIRDIKTSELWKAVQNSKESITKMSNELVEESGVAEIKGELADLNAMRDKGLVEIRKELSELNIETKQEESS
jgi:Sec-independent protein translocase protein TatA